jgi:hypothetical protein
VCLPSEKRKRGSREIARCGSDVSSSFQLQCVVYRLSTHPLGSFARPRPVEHPPFGRFCEVSPKLGALFPLQASSCVESPTFGRFCEVSPSSVFKSSKTVAILFLSIWLWCLHLNTETMNCVQHLLQIALSCTIRLTLTASTHTLVAVSGNDGRNAYLALARASSRCAPPSTWFVVHESQLPANGQAAVLASEVLGHNCNSSRWRRHLCDVTHRCQRSRRSDLRCSLRCFDSIAQLQRLDRLLHPWSRCWQQHRQVQNPSDVPRS